jgi:hypothetical protein
MMCAETIKYYLRIVGYFRYAMRIEYQDIGLLGR